MRHAIVIDDERSIRELVTTMLRSIGWEVDGAATGAAALALVDRNTPDLIMTDLIMPDMEGMEILRQLRKVHSGIPVIVMSGNSVGTRFLSSARLLGARATLAKPFSLGELELAVNSVVEPDAVTEGRTGETGGRVRRSV